MEKYFPFDSVDQHGEPDRVYSAEDFANYFAQFIGNGVFPNPSTGLQCISANSNLVVTVKKGSAYINGRFYLTTDDLKITIDTPSSDYNRKDIIVASLDLLKREIKIKCKKGIASNNPKEESLLRNTDTYELKLAVITVRAGTKSILQSDILDTRMDKNACGVVTSTVDQVDVTTIFNQYKDYWDRKRLENENAWKKQMQSQQSTFEKGYKEKMNTIDKWHQGVLANLETLKTFDFDNISELKGAKKTTTFLSDGSIKEEIKMTSGGQKVAERTTKFLSSGTIESEIKIYKDNSVVKSSKITTTFTGGAIEEVIK